MDIIKSKAQWVKTKASRVKEKTLDRLVKRYRDTQELRRKKAEGTATPVELKTLQRRMKKIKIAAAVIGITLATIAAIAGGTVAYREYQKRERRMLAEKEGEEEAKIIAILAAKSEGEKDQGLRDAIDKGDARSVRMYLQAGANGNAKGPFGNPPLHRAIDIPWGIRRRGHDTVVQVLIDAGVNLNAKGRGGTPLHLAAAEGREKDVSLLLNAGADPLSRNNEGRLPVDVANYRVKQLLLDAMKKQTQRVGRGLQERSEELGQFLPPEIIEPILEGYAAEQLGPERAPVLFKTLTGRAIFLDIERNETVARVKERLKEKLKEIEEGDVDYSIILMGKKLKDEDIFPLRDAAKVATLHVVYRLR